MPADGLTSVLKHSAKLCGMTHVAPDIAGKVEDSLPEDLTFCQVSTFA